MLLFGVLAGVIPMGPWIRLGFLVGGALVWGVVVSSQDGLELGTVGGGSLLGLANAVVGLVLGVGAKGALARLGR